MRLQMKDGRLWISLGLCVLMFFSGCGRTGQGMPIDFADTIEKSETTGENTEGSTGGNTGMGDGGASEDTESDKETQSVGNRLLSFWDNMIVGEENGKIVLLGVVEGLKEENLETVTSVISFKDDILYAIQGTAEGKNYSEIYSLKSGDLIISQKGKNSYAAEWKKSGEDLFVVFPYYNTVGREAWRHYFYLLSQKEDGSYAVEQVYEELESSVYADRLRLVKPVCIHEDLLRDGVTYACKKETKGKVFFKLDSQGKIVDKLRTEHQVEYSVMRTDGGILFREYGAPESNYDTIMYYDTSTGEEMYLYDSRKDSIRPEIMASEGDKIYYNRADDTEFGHTVYRIYSYNLKTLEERLLYTSEAVPGYKNHNGRPGVAGFAVSEGKCLFIMHDKCGASWYRLDTNSDGALESTGLTIYDDTPLKYGDVSYESATIVSETTGKNAYKYYVEKLQLTTEDAGTEAINRVLEERFESQLDIVKRQAEEALELAEEDSLGICSIYMDSVRAIREIGTHYYAIDFNKYASEGYEYLYHSYYLFERSTGEEITLRDIYGGTEEEFKAVVARYTVEDWKKNPHNYFGEYDEEEIYDDLYANTRFDMLMKYGEEGIVISYSPYDSIYALGYIGVEIPYEALGLEEMLE